MIWIGTSGYNYPEWKGSFYPADLAAAKMLPSHTRPGFPTVEINYTFYRMPNEKLVGGWADQPVAVPADAEGAAADHATRLKQTGELVSRFCLVASALGDKLGALLFQLPPNLKKDLPLLEAFLGAAVEGRRGVRVPASVLADRRCVRGGGAKHRALCRRQRKAVDASSGHRTTTRTRLRDEGYARGYRALGRNDRARDLQLPRRLCVFQARGRGKRSGIRQATDGEPRRAAH